MRLERLIKFSLGPAGSGLLGFLTLPFLAWVVSPDDIGRFSIFQICVSLAVIVCSVNTHQSYVREFHLYDDKYTLMKTVIAPALVCLSTFVALCGFSFSFGIVDYWDKATLIIFLVSVISAFFINFQVHHIRMIEDWRSFSYILITPKVLLLLFVFLLNVVDSSPSFIMLISSLALSNFISSVGLLAFYKGYWRKVIDSVIDRSLLRKVLRFSGPLVLSSLAFWGLTSQDRIFLKHFASLAALGEYSIANTAVMSIALISAIFSSLWQPYVFRISEDTNFVSRLSRSLDHMTILVTFIWIGFAVFSDVFSKILPNQYENISRLIVVLAGVPLLTLLGEVAGVGIGIKRRSVLLTVLTVCALCINGFLNYILTARWAAFGAALSLLLSFFIYFILRTEGGFYSWVKVSRIKMYSILLMCMSVSVSHGVFHIERCYSLVLWGGILIALLYAYRTRFLAVFRLMNGKFRC